MQSSNTEAKPTPSLPLEVIDSSMVNSFRSCRKKFYYNYIRHLQPAGRSVHLVAGGAFAAGVDAARKYWYNTATPVWDEMLVHAMRAFMREWKDYTAPEGHAKSFHNTFHALMEYFTRYHPEHDPVKPIKKPDGSPATEFSFAIPLPIKHPITNDPILYAGRFDMLGDWDGLLTVLDEKTTSALGQSWLDQWKMRGQFIGYCWACQQLGYPVRQVVVRGIGLLKTEIKFLSALQQYPQYLIDRWYEELLNTTNEMVACVKLDHFTYNFGDSCAAYGGCAYSQLCEASEPENWVSNYDVRIWNPLLRAEHQPL